MYFFIGNKHYKLKIFWRPLINQSIIQIANLQSVLLAAVLFFLHKEE